MTFREFVKKNPDTKAKNLANLILSNCPEIAVPVLARAIEELRRQGTRSAEHLVIAPFLEQYSTAANGRPVIDDNLFHAFRERIAIGTGERVEFQDMTITQHQRRIQFLESQASGINRTIDLHRNAVEAIRANGVETLRQLYTVEVKAA